MYIKRIIIILQIACVIMLSAKSTSAQTDRTFEVQGLAINPFLIESALDHGQSEERSITLQNTTQGPLAISISINDFTVDKNSNTPKFLESSELADPKFSISEWISITKQPKYELLPGETTELILKLTPPDSAEPGTHYGGLLITTESAPLTGTNTIVEHKVGVIIIAELGRASQQGSITSLIASNEKNDSGNQVRFLLNFNNFGNTHLKPKGEIFIYNIFGKQVGNLYINRDAQIVLPQTEKRFDAIWQPSFNFGWYRAEAILYFGNPKIEARAETSVWLFDPISATLSIAVLALLIVTTVFAVHRYNRWILARNKTSI